MSGDVRELPRRLEVKGITVLTSKQLAAMYDSDTDTLKKNFSRNRDRFIEGKHYISLSGDELREFKNRVTERHLVGNRANLLYLWTEKGALLHAKSLNTDKAWQVYDYLVDFYFRAKEKESGVPEKTEVAIQQSESVRNQVPVPEMEEPIFIFKTLLALAEEQGIVLKLKGIDGYGSMLKGKRIAIRKHQMFETVVYEAAYELAHYFLHYSQGDMVNTPQAETYNKEAERAALMMIRTLDIKAKQNY